MFGKLSVQAKLFTLVTFAATYMVLGNWMFDITWFIGAFIFVAIFFSQVNTKDIKWSKLSGVAFEKKLFTLAFLFRLMALVIVSLAAEINTGEPFYMGAMDAKAYYSSSSYALELWQDEGIKRAYDQIARPGRAPDDYGMFFFLMILHIFTFKSIYLTKLVFCLISSYTVLVGYKLARLLWDERTARLAGLILMVFPLSLFYGVIYLKENLITFLIINLSYLVTKSFTQHRFNLKILVFILAQLGLLFFLRSAAGALMTLLTGGAYFFNYYKGSRIFSIFIGIVILAIFVFFLNFLGLAEIYYDRITAEAAGFGESRFEFVRGVNKLAQLGSIPIFAAGSIFAPFPTLVDYQNIPHGPFNYYIPGLMVWNAMALFALFGLIKSLHKSYRQHNVMLWGFALGYLYVLVDTVLLTSTRFSYSSMPTLLILSAVGIMHTKAIKFWKIYLVIMVVLVVGWNYFKLAGRGLM